MEALGRQAQTSSVFLSYYEIVFPKCNLILYIFKTSHYLDSSALGCEHFQMFECTKTLSSYKFPFLPPPSVISGHINVPVKFSHAFCLYTPPRPLKALAQQYLLSPSSLSAQLSSFFWHSSRILYDVTYLSFLEPICNKSFIFILFSECSFHYHVGITLKDPTRVTCPFTTSIHLQWKTDLCLDS